MLKLRVCENHFSLLKHQMRLVSGFVRVQGTTEGWWKLRRFFLTLVDDWLMIDTLRSSKAERLPNCGQLSYQLTYLIHFDVAPLRLSTSFPFSENFLCENVSNEDSVLAKWEMIMRKTQINESVDQVRRKKNVFPSWSLSFFQVSWKTEEKNEKSQMFFVWKISLWWKFPPGTRSTHDASYSVLFTPDWEQNFHWDVFSIHIT